VNLLRYEKVLEEKHLCFFPPTKETRKQGNKAKQNKKKGNGTTLIRATQESIF
jgi:hypothetical protein